MDKNYPKSNNILWFLNSEKFGIKLGLENTNKLVNFFEQEIKTQKFIHVVGTNGKGTVSNFLHLILTQLGKRCGLFTSPHLITLNERFIVNGKKISDFEMDEILGKIKNAADKLSLKPTFFEISLLLGLLFFAKHNTEFSIIETGMGGRLDATNVLIPKLTIFSRISKDHEKWLGNSLEEIALEKAKTLKNNVSAISIPQTKSVREVLENEAKKVNTNITFIKKPSNLKLSLYGEHQNWNLALAVNAIEILGLPITPKVNLAIQEFTLLGRFSKHFYKGREILCDVAHNEDSSQMLTKTWSKLHKKKATVIFSLSNDKDIEGILNNLMPIAKRFILTEFSNGRSIKISSIFPKIYEICKNWEIEVIHEKHIKHALYKALEFNEKILVTGSFFLVGDMLSFIKNRPIL